ncbi:restriction endonuclease subunit S [Clostridium beijerinckii]|uniref:restriction endonuclease subunit S n=1 Tax=Clostridium beijerinckii TaxID=1520 RepID=UPI0015CD5E82|nr:restriction endonuclease subunit S [Clostridium beijerinckii]
MVLKKISTEHFETIKRSEVKENDIVIAKIGAQFGLSNILPRIDKKAVVSGNSLKLSVDKQKSNTQYIHYQLLHIKNNGTLDLIVSTTAQPAISLGDMNNINIVLPNVQRQDKIVKFLNEKTAQVDSIISKKEALIQILEEAKKSLISDAVTGKVKVVKTSDGYELVERKKEEMKDSGVKWLGDVPKEWDVKRLRFLGNLQNGISKSGDEFGFGYPFVSYGDVYKNISIPKFVNGLVNSSLNDRRIYSVLEGDVFFTRTSETVDEIGFASTCLNTITDATFAGFFN